MNANSKPIVSDPSGPTALSTCCPPRLLRAVLRSGRGILSAVSGMALLTALALMPVSPAAAQTFTTLKSFGIASNISGLNPYSTLVQGPDGTLYGTTSSGEGNGTVFKMQPDSTGFTVLKFFTNSIEGANPRAGVTLSGSVLYGTTVNGGSSGSGTVFKVNTDGSGFMVLYSFAGGSDGANPYAALTLSGGVLYGTTYSGGNLDYGTVFALNPDGTGYTVLYSFNGVPDAANPYADVAVSGNVLYGTTESGGSSDAGTVFALNIDGTGYTVLYNFTGYPSDGEGPHGGMALSGNVLYGTTAYGGNSGAGTVFAMNTDGTGYSVLHNFANFANGANPYAAVTLSGGVLYGTTEGGNYQQGTVFKLNTDGTSYTVLRSFTNSPDGANPYAAVTLSGSVLYGTTYSGGSQFQGTVFEVNTDGSGYTVLKNFARCGDGQNPYAGVTLSGSVLYGTTYSGGSSNLGTVFKVDTDGTGYSVLKNFTGSDGANPYAGIALSGGILYGTTFSGGSSNLGTVFKMNTDGTGFTVLRNFIDIDGTSPVGVTLSSNVLYGTANGGGSSNLGTVFKMNTDGTGFTVLKNFSGGSDGGHPYAGMILTGSVLYGTTSGSGTPIAPANASVFKMNTDGTSYAVLTDFAYTENPVAGLALSGSVLYGATAATGNPNWGIVFKVNTDGAGFTVLHNFTNSPDGANPTSVVIASGGVLYGATYGGGSLGSDGTLFKLNTDGSNFTVLHNFAGYLSEGVNPVGLTFSGSVLYGATYSGGTWKIGSVFKLDLSPPLSIQSLANAVVLTWADPSFALQAAPAVTGFYTNIPGATSPYTNSPGGGQKFFRLIGN